MQKVPKYVVIQENDDERLQAYEATLVEAGYIVTFIDAQRDVFTAEIQCLSPDIILLKSDKLDPHTEKLLAKKRSLPLLRRSKLIFQVPKLSFSVEQFAKKYEVFLLEDDCSIHSFYQMIKKLSLDIEFPSCKLKLENTFSDFSVDLVSISELSFQIVAPVKIPNQSKVHIHSEFLKSLNISEQVFESYEESTYTKDHYYLTTFDFEGVSSDAYRSIKKFIGKNRGENE